MAAVPASASVGSENLVVFAIDLQMQFRQLLCRLGNPRRAGA